MLYYVINYIILGDGQPSKINTFSLYLMKNYIMINNHLQYNKHFVFHLFDNLFEKM